MKILPYLVLSLFLLGCSSEDASQNDKASPALTMNNESPVVAESGGKKSLPEITEEQRENADRTLQFSNLATVVLTDGYYALPDALYDNINYYLDVWRLPKKPRAHGADRAKKAMHPPKGIFNEKEEAALAAAFQEMDQALGSMLKDYTSLEQYVADDSIRDNGKEGKKLGKKIADNHSRFMKARKTWLEMVDARAEQAQEILLREHPLERQILDASKMFSIFREITALLVPENTDKSAVSALRQNLDQVLADAKRPPFPASPQLEREYRGYLKTVDKYLQSLDAGLKEGFFTPQKKILTTDVINCHNAYNSFAKLANQRTMSNR